jgi:hypothetical protein
MQLTELQKSQWEEFISTMPENARELANKFVPWKRYRHKEMDVDTINTYTPISFDEDQDGEITLTCYKNVNIFTPEPYLVYGINPDDLIEID